MIRYIGNYVDFSVSYMMIESFTNLQSWGHLSQKTHNVPIDTWTIENAVFVVRTRSMNDVWYDQRWPFIVLVVCYDMCSSTSIHIRHYRMNDSDEISNSSRHFVREATCIQRKRAVWTVMFTTKTSQHAWIEQMAYESIHSQCIVCFLHSLISTTGNGYISMHHCESNWILDSSTIWSLCQSIKEPLSCWTPVCLDALDLDRWNMVKLLLHKGPNLINF